MISVVHAFVGFTVGNSTEPQVVGVLPHNAANLTFIYKTAVQSVDGFRLAGNPRLWRLESILDRPAETTWVTVMIMIQLVPVVG
jgi:hypothetical protein